MQEDCRCRTSTQFWTPGIVCSQLSLMFESEENLSVEPRLIHVSTHVRTMTHHQLMNRQNLSLWDVARPE
jgi:hypothetical protein